VSKSWDEVQTLLDDPFVDADTKEHLLAAYIKENVDGYPYIEEDDLPDDVREYYDQYPIRGGDFDQGSLDDVYERAQGESDERGYSAGLTQDEIDENTSTLDGMQAPQEGQSTGVEKSDELFELARPALKVFENFIPANDAVPGDSLGRYGKFTMEDINTKFDEQMGLSFKKFLDDAERLRTAHQKLSELNSSTESELNNLYQSWTGPAANASFQHFSEKIVPNVSDLIDYLSTSPDMIGTLVQNLFDECKAKADTVIGLYQPTVGSATPDIAMKVVELANDASDRDKILEVASWVDSVCGSNIENTIRDDNCGLNDENKEYVQRECKKWIRDSFNQDLHENLFATFKQTCEDTVEAVDAYYEELNSYLSEYENEFEAAGAAPPPGTTPPGTTPPPGTQPGTGTTPPPSASGPGGSAPTTPSGSMPPVSTPPATPGGPGSSPGGPGSSPGGPGSVPEVPTPGGTDPGSSPGGPGSSPGGPGSSPGGPGSVPEVPTPGGTDPGSSPGGPGSGPGGPGDPTGEGPGGPGDPTGEEPGDVPPGTTPTTPGEEETVTIDDGDRSISVTSPDGQGQVKVTVDDGSGQPKTYTLDFGEGTGGDTPGAGAPGGAQSGVDGAPTLDQPIEPGPDGKCVIEDGDLTITAERPDGSSDTVVVTVDDGTGEPTTYSLDYSGEDGPAATPQDVPPAAGGPSEAQAMYGQLDGRLDGVIDDLESEQQDFAAGGGQEPAGQYVAAGAEPAIDQGAQSPLDSDPAGQYATSAQASLSDGGGGGAGGGASFFSESGGGAGGQAGSFGLPDHGQYVATPAEHGEAGLASAAENDNGGRHASGQPSGAMGGMPMMGGPGGGSGDQDRAGGQWRTTGDLFDDAADAELRGAFGEGRR
jgi:uncharacterized protein YukE